MNINKPNRTHTQSANTAEMQRSKESGDQHILPMGDPQEDPHRPHRLSREDMQKISAEEANPNQNDSK